jgi:hypothetical protein
VLGVIAYRRNWFMAIPEATGKLWLRIAIFLIVLLPILFVVGGAGEDPTPFLGGIHWQSFAFSIWQHFFCMAMVTGLLVSFRQRFNQQSSLVKAMSASAYTVDIIRQPVAIFVAVALSGIVLYPLIKFPFVALIVVPFCFWLANYIRKLSFARNVL